MACSMHPPRKRGRCTRGLGKRVHRDKEARRECRHRARPDQRPTQHQRPQRHPDQHNRIAAMRMTSSFSTSELEQKTSVFGSSSPTGKQKWDVLVHEPELVRWRRKQSADLGELMVHRWQPHAHQEEQTPCSPSLNLHRAPLCTNSNNTNVTVGLGH